DVGGEVGAGQVSPGLTKRDSSLVGNERADEYRARFLPAAPCVRLHLGDVLVRRGGSGGGLSQRSADEVVVVLVDLVHVALESERPVLGRPLLDVLHTAGNLLCRKILA